MNLLKRFSRTFIEFELKCRKQQAFAKAAGAGEEEVFLSCNNAMKVFCLIHINIAAFPQLPKILYANWILYTSKDRKLVLL